MTVFSRLLCAIATLPISFAVTALAQDRGSIDLVFPVGCELDQDCFLQQFVDMDMGPKAIDPFCGGSSYDGHKGTDIRLRSLEDLNENVAVLAAAGGIVKGVRNNMSDRLVKNDVDREVVKGKECGNGVVIAHGNHVETQYCHLKRGSVKVRAGQTVKAGDRLGAIGVSGLTQFPHLHVQLRKGSEIIDPFTGNLQSEGCDRGTDGSWWADQSVLKGRRDRILLGSHLTGAVFKHDDLVVQLPEKLSQRDSATIGWVWYSNLHKGDRVYIKVEGPGGFKTENLSKPLNRDKASWSGYAGKKRQPKTGEYKLTTYILRGDDDGAREKLSFSEKIIRID